MTIKRLAALAIAVFMLVGLATAACAEEKTAKIGILQYIEHESLDEAVRGFKDVLSEQGYGEDCFTFKNASGDNAALQLIAGDLAAQSDLMLAVSTPAVQAASAATDEIPVLGTAVTDYVSAGLVMSNELPGANVSGTSDEASVTKQIDLLLELAPQAQVIGIIYTSAEVNSQVQADEAAAYIEQLGLKSVVKTFSAVGDMQQATEVLAGKVDAVFIPTDNIFASAMEIVAAIAETTELPVVAGARNMVKAGALATCGIDYYELGRQTGLMAIDILENGADISKMPIQFQEEHVVDLNQDMADEIGFAFPEELVSRAVVVRAGQAE